MTDTYAHRRSIFGKMILQVRDRTPWGNDGAYFLGDWRDATFAEANEHARALGALQARVNRAEVRAKAQKDARTLKLQTMHIVGGV